MLPQGMQGINYFPQGLKDVFWNGTNWPTPGTVPPAIVSDLAMLVEWGFTSIRMFLDVSASNAPDSTGTFNFPSPTTNQLTRLTSFFGACNTAGIKAQVCLFDFFNNFGQIDASETWVAAIIGAIQAANVEDAVVCYELRNEIPFADGGAYSGTFDGGYTWPTSPMPTLATAVTHWAQTLVAYMRTLTTVPLTASTTESTDNFVVFPAMLAAMTGEAALDWYEHHTYPDYAGYLIAQIATAKSVANGARMRIGETGATTAPSGTQSQAMADQAQADWLLTARYACQAVGLGEPQPWALYDQTGAVFGLWDESGNPRAAAMQYVQHPLGSTVPAPGLNSSYVGPTVDVNGQVVPQSWQLYKGNAGNQNISAVTACGAVTLTTTGYPGTDNPPGITAWLNQEITPGDELSVSVALSGNAIGAVLWVDFWDATGYVATASQSVPDLTSTPQTVTLTTTVPVSAYAASVLVVFAPGTGGAASMTLSPLVANRVLTLAGTHRRLLVPA